jgi:hypothetical protein
MAWAAAALVAPSRPAVVRASRPALRRWRSSSVQARWRSMSAGSCAPARAAQCR